MLNILIPMAGRGSRFAKVGYDLPKPLIRIHENPMISLVIDNLRPKREHRFIFIGLQEHEEKYQIKRFLKSLLPDCEVILISKVTEGAACTVLEAKRFIDNDKPLMIANSDQWIDFDINEYLNFMDLQKLDGLIMTMKANDPKWSFVALENDIVKRVVEKEVISNEATVGIYNFRKGSDFVRSAERMIKKEIRTNGEFYVAPVYNESLELGAKVGVYNIGSDFEGMFGLGTPEDLNNFLKCPFSFKYKKTII